MGARNACWLLAFCAGAAFAQTAPIGPSTPAPEACPTPAQTTRSHLYGLWRVAFDGRPSSAIMLLEKHPDADEGVYGGVSRDGVRSLLAGDIEDGVLILEESDDGKRISGTWDGTVVDGSCGREIRGTWTSEIDDSKRTFVLVKTRAGGD